MSMGSIICHILVSCIDTCKQMTLQAEQQKLTVLFYRELAI